MSRDPVTEKRLIDLEVKKPNAFPMTDPHRLALNADKVARGFHFVSWIRAADGCRFSATIVGGFGQAEKFVQAVQRFEKPSVVVIGKEPYEGLPPRVSSMSLTPTLKLPVGLVPEAGQIVVPLTPATAPDPRPTGEVAP